METYAPREIRFRSLRTSGPWTLKLYSVRYGDRPIDWAGFEVGLELAMRSLPEPDAEAGRPGLGALIAHQGRTGDYVVLLWWDHENELPTRLWIRRSPDEAWRPAVVGESFCVWDLEVMWAEREAWIATMLSAGGQNRRDYLEMVPDRFR